MGGLYILELMGIVESIRMGCHLENRLHPAVFPLNLAGFTVAGMCDRCTEEFTDIAGLFSSIKELSVQMYSDGVRYCVPISIDEMNVLE